MRGNVPNVRVLSIAIVFLSASAPAHASLTGVDIFVNKVYQQTGPGTTNLSGYFFNAGATLTNAGDFANGSLTACGGGTGCPQALAPFGATFNFGSPIVDLATLTTKYPFGAYTVMVSNPGSASSTLNYTQNLFTSTIPALTAASFNALQGLNAANGATINFNAFTPAPQATFFDTFFSISGPGGGFSAPFLPNTATSVFVPGGQLLPNSTYTFELDFSDRIQSQDANGVTDLQGFDVRADGTFTTAAAATPEPCSFALVALGMAAYAWKRKIRA